MKSFSTTWLWASLTLTSVTTITLAGSLLPVSHNINANYRCKYFLPIKLSSSLKLEYIVVIQPVTITTTNKTVRYQKLDEDCLRNELYTYDNRESMLPQIKSFKSTWTRRWSHGYKQIFFILMIRNHCQLVLATWQKVCQAYYKMMK